MNPEVDVTFVYAGRIAHGRSRPVGDRLIDVNMDREPRPIPAYPGDPTAYMTFRLVLTPPFDMKEGVDWIRGHYAPESPEAQALLVAYALTE